MAENFLEEMYREAELACELKQIVEYAKVHDEYHVVEMGNKLLPGLGNVCKKYIQQDAAKGTELWNAVRILIEVDDDLILRGDTIESRILPLLEEKIQRFGSGIYVENDEGDYGFESSASGFLTLKDLKRDKYIHRNSPVGLVSLKKKFMIWQVRNLISVLPNNWAKSCLTI